MGFDLSIETARPDDSVRAAQMAAAKRGEYEAYSPVFWRVADGAIEVHEPFLAKCIADTETFSSHAARDGEDLAGIAIAARRVFPPPFRYDVEPSWLVDDFFVSEGEEWPTVGRALLDAVEDAAQEGGAERLIVLTARLDEPKRTMLERAGYKRGASWWVHPVSPDPGEPGELLSTEAITGLAPPVYDPGGTTALALKISDPGEVTAFDLWAVASGAVLAIVPARATQPELERALEATGYEAASDWFLKNLAE